MRNALNCKTVIVLLVLSLFLTGADNGEQNKDRSDALRDRQEKLLDRIRTLQAEQDFLLFQKAMYSADSKYLVLNLTERTGQLRYKNRILKDFQFLPTKDHPARKFRTGMLALTKKREGKNARHGLVFGKALVFERKGAAIPPDEADIPALFLTRKDMQSIFFALETGARAYLVR
jgi:hypothetical protein